MLATGRLTKDRFEELSKQADEIMAVKAIKAKQAKGEDGTPEMHAIWDYEHRRIIDRVESVREMVKSVH